MIPVLVLAVTALAVVVEPAMADRATRQARRATRGGWLFGRNRGQQQMVAADSTTGQVQQVGTLQPGQPMPQQQGYRSYYRVPTPDAPAGTVLLNVQVPADAKVWIEGQETKQTGPSRQFVTPTLTQGQQYTYEVKAQWNEGSQKITRTRRVPVQAGQGVTINLLQPTQEELRQQQNSKTEERNNE
jgi:uncharacterized protein (TIGR03000 family)